MEIPEIKSCLSLQAVMDYYQLKIDRNGRSLCPWHQDKNPSLQVYLKTNSWTCFSTKCTAGSGDQIDMIRLMERCSIHEALLKAKELVGHELVNLAQEAAKKVAIDERVQLLSRAFSFYVNALKQTKSAVAYLESRNLWKGFAGKTALDVGFNGGRFHYRGKMTEAEKQNWIDLGMMKPIKDGNSYRTWAKDCIIFPLKNKKEQIVGYYGRSITNNSNQRHYYHKHRQGLYPHYPQSGVKRLILTESVVDAASLLMAGIIEGELGVLACYGTKGLMEEHLQAIQSSKDIEELIFFFDGDQAGEEAVEKYAQQLGSWSKSLIISKVATPQGEDINSLHQGHEPSLFSHLLAQRTVLVSSAGKPSELFSFNGKTKETKDNLVLQSKLDSSDTTHLVYETEELQIHIWGGIEPHNLSKLRVSMHIERKGVGGKTFRDEVNLYSFSGVKRITGTISEAMGISSAYISAVLADLSKQLEQYRLSIKDKKAAQQSQKVGMSAAQSKAALALLQSPHLLRKTLELIEQSGLVGQQKNGLLLFLLYLSRCFKSPLHAILFGKSGSGKTYLQTCISACLPPEDVQVVTSLTENTLYYSPKGFWSHKVLIIEDLEGVYQAFLPLRELMSKQEISKLTTDKDSKGNNKQVELKVEGPTCISGATTKEWIYEDNANRSYLLIIDESKHQEDLVMEYQRKRYAGLIDQAKQQAAKVLLQNAQRLLKRDLSIINPYAEQLSLPPKLFKKLRTNGQYLKLIQLITFYNQYNREVKQDEQGKSYIETSIEDIAWANRLIRESLLRKSDELSSNQRQFFERLKLLVSAKPTSERSFYAKEIRQQFRLNPMTVHRHLRQLELRGYIEQIGGNKKTGYEYQIKQWQDYEDLQKEIALMDSNLRSIQARVVQKANKS